MKSKIGLLGGTFDPIHVAHILMGEQAADELGLGKVIYMPAGAPPHKSDDVVASAAHRLAMVKLALDDCPRLEVSELELAREAPSYTIDTVRTLLAELGSETVLHLIIGSDSLLELHTWKDYEDLLRLVRLAVYPRPGAVAAERGPFEEAKVDVLSAGAAEFNVSSTAIRERVRSGRSIKYLVPPVVENYIRENGLYGGA